MCLIIVGRKPVTMVMAIKCYHGDGCYQAVLTYSITTFVQAQHNR